MAKSQSRGRDSSGLAFRDERARRIQVFKGPIQLDALVKSRDVSRHLAEALAAYAEGDRRAFAIIGHSRLVTNGSQMHIANNQPVIRDGVVGIHNGIVVNDRDIWSAHAGLMREHEIDTEVLLAVIGERLRAGATIPAAIVGVNDEIEGTVSAALLFDDTPALALTTNNGSLYTLTDGRSLLMFASEEYPLRAVAKSMRNDTSAKFALRQIVARSGLVLWLDTFESQSFEYADAGLPPAPARRSYGEPFTIDVCSVGSSDEQRALVVDVALIARGPNAAREAALLEFNQERIAALPRCRRCILPETFPFIQFDEHGVCNYCRQNRPKNQPRPIDELVELLTPYRRQDGSADCIVPFSGGRDSTFALHTIKTRLGLNPIAFTYDWGMVTDLGRRNIARVCGKLGVENIIVAADIRWKRDNIRKNIGAWLRKPHLGMIPLFMAGDKYFYYYAERLKRQTGIALNIWGVNPLENTDFKVGFLGVAPDFAKKRIYSLSPRRQVRLLQGVSRAILSNPGYLNTSVWDTLGSFVSRSIMPHTDYYHLFDYIPWDEVEVDHLLLDEYHWETAPDTRSTWRIGDGTAAFYNYIYYTVAGFSEHDTFRSNQIREGAITREDALRRANEDNRPRYPTIKWYADVVNVDYETVIKVVNGIPKLYA